ncbi:MAG: Npt1/Npt2 family nucleotide transporter [Pseudomonadota bacterium]
MSTDSPEGVSLAEHRKGPVALLLAVNLLLIIAGYYTVKTASRSIVLEDAGSEMLPYIWIGSALTMLLLVPLYQAAARRLSRFSLLFSTLALSVVAILVFWFRLKTPTINEAALFYGLCDIMSVVIVEQFWSLTNSIFLVGQARRWYWAIGSGGLLGGIAGSLLAVWLISEAGMTTTDLLLVAVAIVSAIGFATAGMVARGMLRPSEAAAAPADVAPDESTSAREKSYLLLVAIILLLAQLVSPFIEYQFMTLVGDRFADQDERTVYLSSVFAWISGVALLINLSMTSWVHRRFGALGGLLVRPLVIIAGSAAFLAAPVLNVAAVLRVMDKALAYSINRASRELLYVPMHPSTVYDAKAWIDMLGFRVFKVFGSFVILLLTVHIHLPASLAELSLIVLAACLLWAAVILRVRRRFSAMLPTQLCDMPGAQPRFG